MYHHFDVGAWCKGDEKNHGIVFLRKANTLEKTAIEKEKCIAG